MDRGVLSDAAVVKASRDFVCARLATYESAEEAKFLSSIARTASGSLENTVFTVLAPDGKTPLVPAGRGPHHAFGGTRDDSAKETAAGLGRIAAQHPGKPGVMRQVPYLEDLRLGLNVASCDLLPLVVVAAKDAESRKKVEDALAPLAWNTAFIGRLEYAAAADLADLKKIDGAVQREGIVVVEPDAYGLKGKALAQSATASEADLRKALEAGLKGFVPKSKDSRRHIEEGHRAGVYWKTEIPVTDPKAPK